jgi:hypothetical protein
MTGWFPAAASTPERPLARIIPESCNTRKNDDNQGRVSLNLLSVPGHSVAARTIGRVNLLSYTVLWSTKREAKTMNHPRTRVTLLWIARILMIVFIVFLTMFSLDVFEMEATLLEKLGGFIMHSIPSLVLVAVLLISWRNPLLGGVLTLASAGALMLRWHLWRGMTFVTIILPVIVVGILFIAAHVAGRKQVPSPSQ